MSHRNLPTPASSTVPLSEVIDSWALVRPYILEDARASYRHWWERETKDVWFTYLNIHRGDPSPQEIVRRLYPHLFPEKPRRRRWRSSYRRDWDKARLVEHTVVLPDGEEITYQWRSEHYSYRRDDVPFREGHCKGVVKIGQKIGQTAPSIEANCEELFRKQAKKDWRKRKLKDVRRNPKCPTRWPFSCGAKRSAQIDCNRSDRRKARALLQQGRYDEVETRHPPVDTWMWD